MESSSITVKIDWAAWQNGPVKESLHFLTKPYTADLRAGGAGLTFGCVFFFPLAFFMRPLTGDDFSARCYP